MPESPLGPNAAAAFQGELTSGDASARGSFVSGVLAEHGVTSLVFRQGDAVETLTCRATDLPGRLADAASASNACPTAVESEDATFIVEPVRIRWSTPNASLAHALRALA